MNETELSILGALEELGKKAYETTIVTNGTYHRVTIEGNSNKSRTSEDKNLLAAIAYAAISMIPHAYKKEPQP